MDQYCSCFYHIDVLFFYRAYNCSLMSFRWFFPIDWAHLIHDKQQFVLFNLSIVSALICQPESLINSCMHTLSMSSYPRIKQSLLAGCTDFPTLVQQGLLSNGIDIHPHNCTHIQVLYDFSKVPLVLNTFSQFHEILFTIKSIMN